MSDIKWIKLSCDLFGNRKIKMIRAGNHGDSAVLFWISLLCLAGQTNDNGKVYLTENMPLTVDSLATVTGFGETDACLFLEQFEQLGMIDFSTDFGHLHITDWNNHQSAEALDLIRLQNRERQQRFRDKHKSPLRVTRSNVIEEKKTDKEKDKEKEKTTTSVGREVYSDAFLRFWTVYPKKELKKRAFAIWQQKNLDGKTDEIVKHVTFMTKQADWLTENGRYIPYPNNYLASERWEDCEIPEPTFRKKSKILELLEKEEKVS